MDFMGDSLADKRSYRIFNVIDDYARHALTIEMDISLTANRVVRVLERLCEGHGAPASIRSDNGPEFTSEVTQAWAKERGIRWDFIQPAARRRTPISSDSTARIGWKSSMPISSDHSTKRERSPRNGSRFTTNNAPTAPSVTCRRWRSNDDGSSGSFQKRLDSGKGD